MFRDKYLDLYMCIYGKPWIFNIWVTIAKTKHLAIPVSLRPFDNHTEPIFFLTLSSRPFQLNFKYESNLIRILAELS